jgi:hypothetical protein
MAFGDSYDHKPEKAASVSVKLDSLYYGQARKVLVAVSLPPDSRIEDLGEYLTAQLEYTNVNCETSIVAAKASTAVLGPLVDMDKEAGETLLRQKFVHLLSELIAARSDGASNRKNLPERAQERVQDFLDKNAGQHRGHGILVDTDSQVKLAVSQTDFWSRWGMNYVCSLLTAHKQQRCNNFKDKSVEGYGGKLFREERDRTDDIFRYKSLTLLVQKYLLYWYKTTNSDASCSCSNLPPPTPSRRVENEVGGGGGGGGPTAPPAVQFANLFNNANNGCFHGDCLVSMADGSKKKISLLVKGDKLAASPHAGHLVAGHLVSS